MTTLPRHIFAAALCLLMAVPLGAVKPQRDTLEFSNEYLDTVKVSGAAAINNYSLIGVEYGVSMLGFSFNPDKSGTSRSICPNYIGVMFTHYEKLFDRIPNFAFRTGLVYTHEGFSFETDPDTGEYMGSVDGAVRCRIELLEIPFLAGFHADISHFKIQGEVGVYGGYRRSIEREGPYMDPKYATDWHDYEFRWDYGLRGGAGFAIMLDPIEIHFNAVIRWGWQSLYEPDYNSKYYYRFAYPLDFTVTAGIHFQLSKRSGKTSSMLRQQAKEQVYGKTEDTER